MRYIHLSSDFQNFTFTLDHKAKTVIMEWHAPIFFDVNSCVGLKEITITPLNPKLAPGPKGCFFVSCNIANTDLFNPRKILTAVPVKNHTPFIHTQFSNPSTYS